MTLIQEVLEAAPEKPEDGWNVGHLANLGLLLSAEGVSVRLDLFNLNLLFDLIEAGEAGEVRDHENRIIEVSPQSKIVILKIRGDETYPNGVILDSSTLKEMGLEEYEEAEEAEPETEPEPSSEFDPLDQEDKISAKFDALEESIGFKRPTKKLKVQFNLRTPSDKLDLAAFSISKPEKRIVRLLKGDPVKLKQNEI
jgi:hypothetical protein